MAETEGATGRVDEIGESGQALPLERNGGRLWARNTVRQKGRCSAAKDALDMLAEYKKKTNIRIGLALLLWIVALVLVTTIAYAIIVGFPLFLGGLALFIMGCSAYAKGKGYHGAWGLLGLLGVVPGLIVLFCLPDMHKYSDLDSVIERGSPDAPGPATRDVASGDREPSGARRIACPKCGHKIAAAAKSCPECGTPISESMNPK